MRLDHIAGKRAIDRSRAERLGRGNVNKPPLHKLGLSQTYEDEDRRKFLEVCGELAAVTRRRSRAWQCGKSGFGSGGGDDSPNGKSAGEQSREVLHAQR